MIYGQTGLLTPGPLVERLGQDMEGFFELDVADEAARTLRRAASTGRPLGAAAWVKALEASTGRGLPARPSGRPPQGAGPTRPTWRAVSIKARHDMENCACPQLPGCS